MLPVIAKLDAVQNVAIASAIIVSVYQNVMVARAAQTSQVKQNANPTPGIFIRCPDLHLDQEDRRALIHNKRLSDKHIYAAQILQFAHIGGLRPPTLSQTGQWQIM